MQVYYVLNKETFEDTDVRKKYQALVSFNWQREGVSILGWQGNKILKYLVIQNYRIGKQEVGFAGGFRNVQLVDFRISKFLI